MSAPSSGSAVLGGFVPIAVATIAPPPSERPILTKERLDELLVILERWHARRAAELREARR